MFRRALAEAAFALLLGASVAVGEPTELTPYSGLTISIQGGQLVISPDQPYIWCTALEDPIPVFAEMDVWDVVTMGKFELPNEGDDPTGGWNGLKNSHSLRDGSLGMVGLEVVLRNNSPAMIRLPHLLKPGDMGRIRRWCNGGPPEQDYLFVRFAISVGQGPQGKHVDPGIGVRR